MKTFDITHISLAGEFKEKQIEILILRTFFFCAKFVSNAFKRKIEILLNLKIERFKERQKGFQFLMEMLNFLLKRKIVNYSLKSFDDVQIKVRDP